MRARVIRLRKDGVLLGIPICRDSFAASNVVADGHLEMPRGRHFTLRSENSSPGNGVIAELFDPRLISIEHAWMHVRGFERSTLNQLEAGVLQEWIVMPGWN